MWPIIEWLVRRFGYVVFKIRQTKQQRRAKARRRQQLSALVIHEIARATSLNPDYLLQPTT